jgi:replicative DNA helicase
MSKDIKNNEIYDFSSERVVISYILQQGSKALADIGASLTKDDFYSERNQSIIAIAEKILSESDQRSITIDNVLTTAKELNLHKLVGTNKEDIEYIKLCKQSVVNTEEISSFVKKVKYWSVIRGLRARYENGLDRIEHLTGQESLSDILEGAEKDIFDFVPDLLNKDDIVNLGEFSEKYIDYLAKNPVIIPGLPSGYPRWDKCIGGGLRRGTVNVICARPKVGKSSWCLNIAHNLVKQKIPVLYLDTELNKEVQAVRFTSLTSRVEQGLIETGQFTKNEEYKQAVYTKLKENAQLPFTLVNVSGKSPSEMLSTMRRWISQNVGRDSNGKTKDCLVILDYLKLMDSSELGNLQEYQYIGDVMTKFHNFAVKYDVPILSALQLNRDGINKDDTSGASISDRISWLCSNMSFLKLKTDEDYASGDDKKNGDRKIIVIVTRFGAGMDPSNEYINVRSNLQYCEFLEGRFNYEVKAEKQQLVPDEDDEDFIGNLDDKETKQELIL